MVFQWDSKNKSEDIEYICKVFFETFKMPIYFLDENNEIVFSFSYGYAQSPLHSNINKQLQDLFITNEFSDIPILKSTVYQENYFGIQLINNNNFHGTFVVGPSVYAYVTAEIIDTLISVNNIPLSHKRDLINYYNSIPIMDYTKLINTSLFLHYSLYNKKLDLPYVVERNSKLSNVSIKMDNIFKESISTNRQNYYFHHSQTQERNIYNCIKDGNKENLMKSMLSPSDGEMGILSKNNPLRDKKNLAICTVALATRAAMEGGLDSESAYTLSDLYIQGIEEINDIKDLYDFTFKIFCDFADRVHAVKKNRYSRTINKIINFINKNLYDDICISKVSSHVELNPNYLSELFKKEYGVTISDYIQNKKIEEAKRLLSLSNYSILDISTWLNFHDQSHFTRVFKKLTGVTPKKYKDEKLF